MKKKQPKTRGRKTPTARNQKQHSNARTRKPKAVDWEDAYCAALAATCHCGRAAEAAGVFHSTVWRRRQADALFEKAYQDALKMGAHLLEAEAVRRASEGLRRVKFNAKTGEPYIDPETGKPYIEHEYSDMLMLALLKRHFPEQYRERTQSEHSIMPSLARPIIVNLPPIIATPPPRRPPKS